MQLSLGPRIGTAVLVSILALGVACGDEEDDEGASSQQTPTTLGTARITIQNFAFLGIDSTAANVPFTIENKDTVPHTVSSVDNKFPVWAVDGGQTKSFGSLAPGTYAIRCDIHPAQMTGTLIVK